MRVTAAATVLFGVTSLLAACSSSSGLATNAIEGGPGQDIVVSIANVESGMMTDREGSRQYELQVEVSNVSSGPLTVTRVSMMPYDDVGGALQMQSTSRNFNEMIDPGEDHLFTLFVTGRLVRNFRLDEQKTLTFRVVVALSNGDTYYYTFEGPVRQ